MTIDQYASLYDQAGQDFGVDPNLLRAQGQAESSGDPNAVGPDTKYGNAEGIAQFIPDTAKRLGVTNPKDPSQAIAAQAKLMAENIKRYGNIADAVSAYHGGTDRANWGPKTQDYQKKVLKNYQGTKMASNDIPAEDDPFASAAAEIAAKQQISPQSPQATTEDDPFESAAKEIATKTQQIAATQRPEAGPEWLQNIGKATDALGASMTPTKMAMIVPSLGVAPALSAVAGVASSIPYLGTAASYLAGSAPEGAGALTNLGYNAASGAAQGAIVNKMMGGDAGSGAVAGGALNSAVVPALGGAGKLASMGYNALSGGGSQISPEVANLAKDASEKYGVNIPGGLLSDNPLVKDVYSTLHRFGATPESDNIANFTKAASKTFGGNTPKLTRGAMDDAEERIGGMFDDVWKATPQLKISDATLNKLTSIHGDAEAIMPNDSRIPRQINNILDVAAKNNGMIPSSLAKNLVSTQSQLHKLTRLGTDPAADLAFDIKNTLYDSLGENAPPEVLEKYNQAKQFYKNYKTIEGAKPNPVTGELSPTSLANSVNKTANKFGRNGLTDLQTLGDIGQQFKLTPTSGTAEKLLAAKLAAGGLSGFRYNPEEGVHYSPEGALMTTGAIFGGNAAGKYLSSTGYRNRLIQSALQNKIGMTPMAELLSHSPAISNSLLTGKQLVNPTQ